MTSKEALEKLLDNLWLTKEQCEGESNDTIATRFEEFCNFAHELSKEVTD